MTTELDGFEEFAFDTGRSDRAGGRERVVYRRGKGPAIVVIHELPGMTPECVELARKIADEGFTVYMPLLFGEPNQNYGLTPLLWSCVWKEFSVLSKYGKSPAADWLRALARQAHAEQGGKGVGAIGMCFTGRFALSLMMDAEMIAPVLAEPSSSYSNSAPGVPLEEWDNAVKRSKNEGIPVLGLRFTGDPLCRKERFENSSQPMRNAEGTAAMVSRLLTVLGQPNAPAWAGKGGFSRGSPRLPSRELSIAVSSPQMYAPAPVWT